MRLLKMKKYLRAAVALAALIVSCSSPVKEPSAVVSGRMIGNDVETLYLVKATDGLDNSEMVDSVRLDENGCYRFELSQTDSSPRFYKLVYAGGRPVTLLIGDGDRITVDSAGDIFHNYTIEGSDESELIRQFNREYYGGYDRLLSLADMASHASSSEAAALNKQIYRTIVETIQAQVRFVGAHADRLASVYAMRQTLPAPFAEAFAGEGITNAHRNTVVEAVGRSYPTSPYIDVLRADMAAEQAVAELSDKITYQDFPEIELPDIYGTRHKLSQMRGKVILLYFWAAGLGNSNTMNADLRTVYDKYHDRGLEIYQVSADTDSVTWIEAVRGQKLPWVSVCDYQGPYSLPFRVYNVTSLPTVYLIDREGDIVATGSTLAELDRRIAALL